MKRVETAISRLMPDIDGKRVLEPACGCAEFSIAATAHAAEVVCFDLDDQRLNPEATHTKGSALKSWIHSDALPGRFFDTVVLYNAIGHLAHIAEPVLWECLRVVNTTGVAWVVSSFRMDKAVIQERFCRCWIIWSCLIPRKRTQFTPMFRSGGKRMAFDYKKEYKEFYLPKDKPSFVTVPPMNYLAVRGKGDPNAASGEYKDVIGLLYGIAFTIKMSKKGSHQIEG